MEAATKERNIGPKPTARDGDEDIVKRLTAENERLRAHAAAMTDRAEGYRTALVEAVTKLRMAADDASRAGMLLDRLAQEKANTPHSAPG